MEDVFQNVVGDREPNDMLDEPLLKVILPDWTNALSGFQANATVSHDTAHALEQIEQLYNDTHAEFVEWADEMDVRSLNEHDPGTVLFMVLFRSLQDEFAAKQNLNPHKITVLLQHKYTVE